MDREESKLQLHEALTHDDLEAMGKLLSEGANVNAKDGDERTPLHRAVLENRGEEIEEFLLSKGAKYDAVDDEGTAPMIDGELLDRHLEKKKAGESFGGDELH